jgi:putative glutamine amidotransferase
VIGVTGPDRGGLAAWWFTALAVWRAGGRPLRIHPSRPRSIEALDGLIIGGGADVGPALYGETRPVRLAQLADRIRRGWRRWFGVVLFPLVWLLRRMLGKKRGGPDPARDALELPLIEQAMDAGLPLLGICRGMQLINVAGGGSLHQSLEGYYDEHPQIRSVLPRKQVLLRQDSRLQAILACDACRVNALHNQAIDRLGLTMIAVAAEPNGVVQAIERDGRDWVIGVQWHPEYLPQDPRQRALFRALVERAGAAA